MTRSDPDPIVRAEVVSRYARYRGLGEPSLAGWREPRRANGEFARRGATPPLGRGRSPSTGSTRNATSEVCQIVVSTPPIRDLADTALRFVDE